MVLTTILSSYILAKVAIKESRRHRLRVQNDGGMNPDA